MTTTLWTKILESIMDTQQTNQDWPYITCYDPKV